MDDDSSLSSGSSDDTGNTVKQEELVTNWRLRLSASHLPKRGGLLMKTSPDTFATVAAIIRKTHSPSSRRLSPPLISSTNSFESKHKILHISSDDYLMGWGSTEV
jgi:hypothetical protein